MTARVLLADDHAVVRSGLRAVLESEGLQVVGEAGDGQEAIRLAKKLKPAVAVIDFSMPVLNGIDAAKGMRKCSPRTKTILITMHDNEAYVMEAVRAGISGYVVKTQATSDLVDAIRDVLAGGVYLSPELSKTVINTFLSNKEQAPDPLTLRERQVLQLIAEGNSTKEAAYRLSLSVKTVETHRAKIMEKLDIHHVAGLVRFAIRRGMIQP